ncbi:hypothetical protein [Micromonospora sp. CA-246542]|uniref:hypothetical protein n=1 Tax=Micromonospora sp. CA-246542 TaxID=3239959 RepID=UPI003D908434
MTAGDGVAVGVGVETGVDVDVGFGVTDGFGDTDGFGVVVDVGGGGAVDAGGGGADATGGAAEVAGGGAAEVAGALGVAVPAVGDGGTVPGADVVVDAVGGVGVGEVPVVGDVGAEVAVEGDVGAGAGVVGDGEPAVDVEVAACAVGGLDVVAGADADVDGAATDTGGDCGLADVGVEAVLDVGVDAAADVPEADVDGELADETGVGVAVAADEAGGEAVVEPDVVVVAVGLPPVAGVELPAPADPPAAADVPVGDDEVLIGVEPVGVAAPPVCPPDGPPTVTTGVVPAVVPDVGVPAAPLPEVPAT